MRVSLMALILIMSANLLAGCGSSESRFSSAHQCSVDLSYAETSTSGNLDLVTYSKESPDTCLDVVSQNSGGLRLGIVVAAEPSAAHLHAIEMKGRVDLLEDDTATALSSGSLNWTKEYRPTSGMTPEERDNVKGFMLPWEDRVPFLLEVTFTMPAGSEKSLYPQTVSVSLNAMKHEDN